MCYVRVDRMRTFADVQQIFARGLMHHSDITAVVDDYKSNIDFCSLQLIYPVVTDFITPTCSFGAVRDLRRRDPRSDTLSADCCRQRILLIKHLRPFFVLRQTANNF